MPPSPGTATAPRSAMDHPVHRGRMVRAGAACRFLSFYCELSGLRTAMRKFAKRLFGRQPPLARAGDDTPSAIDNAPEAAKEVIPAEERLQIEQHFDAKFYLACNPDVAEAGLDPLDHFVAYGWQEGRNPTPWFSIAEHLERNPELRQQRINPFYHFLQSQAQHAISGAAAAGSEPDPGKTAPDPTPDAERSVVAPHFDAVYYIASNGDVAASRTDPLEHFLKYGWREHRNPAPWFDIGQYLLSRPDIAHSGVNPFYYYLLTRQGDLRSNGGHELAVKTAAISDPNGPTDVFQRSVIEPYFDSSYYLSTYGDVAASGVDPLSHFMSAGWREGRNPNGQFDVTEYLRLNDDVKHSGINPFYHYIVAGKSEGRPLKSEHYEEKRLISNARSMSEKDAANRRLPSFRAALTTDALRTVLERLLPRHRDRVVISLSHDDYTGNYGGIQNCIGREQEGFNARGISYVHLSPGRPSLHFRPNDETDDIITMIIDGDRGGHASAGDVIACLAEHFARTGAETHFVIHSLLGFALPFIINLHKILNARRSIVWIHDCSTLCTNYALLRNDVEFCWAPACDTPACTVCVYGEERAVHLSALKRLFECLKPVALFPSEVMREFWHSRSNLLTTGSRVVAHATPNFASEHRSSTLRHTIRIAFIGMAAPHKGWHVFRELAESRRHDSRYSFFHFATNSGPSTPAIHFIETTANARQPNAMIEALCAHDIDVVIQWSLCFETFSYSTLEALLAGAFVIARADSGNAARLVMEQRTGILLNDKDKLLELFAQGNILRDLRQFRARRVPVGVIAPNDPSFYIIDESEDVHA